MRGLAIFTLNSTYLFDDGQVMWTPNDGYRTEQQFGSAVMLAGIWYTLVLKPTEPIADWLGIGGADNKSIAFSFKRSTFGYDDEVVSVVTSRVRNYAYLGEGETTDAQGRSLVFRTETDSYTVAKDTLLGAIDELGTNVSLGKASFGRQARATKLVMDVLAVPLVEARRYVKQVEEACLTVKVEINSTPLADWERDLIEQY